MLDVNPMILIWLWCAAGPLRRNRSVSATFRPRLAATQGYCARPTSGHSWPARCAGRPQLGFDPEMPITRQIIFTRAHTRGTGPGRSSSFQPLPGRGYFLSFICSLRCILSRRSRMPCPTSENQIAIDQQPILGLQWNTFGRPTG